MTKRSLLPVLLLAMLLAALAAAPSAMAIPPSTTTITSPADGLYALYNFETGAGTLSVTGTMAGPLGGVDIRCYSQVDNNYNTLQNNVAVDLSGNFSVTDASVEFLESTNCLLVAVPTGTFPTIPDPLYTGVRITVNETGETSSDGHRWDFYDYAGQTAGSYGYDASSQCGINYSQLNDVATNRATTYVFDCNQYFRQYKPASDAPQISGFQVDGLNAFGASRFSNGGAGLTAGFPTFSHTFSVDPVTHDATITENSGFSTCPANAVAPTSPDCDSATDVGVSLNRVMHQDHAGLVSRVTDVFHNNTDSPKTLNLAYRQWMYLNLSGSADHFTYSFPNGTTLVDPAPFAQVSGPLAPSSTIYISDQSRPDGDVSAGRGAITSFPGADSAVFEGDDIFYLRYTNRTIPPRGSFTVEGVFSQAYGQAQLAGLATEASNAITPKPTFGAPTKFSLKLEKKKKPTKITYATGESVACPAFGQACAISGALTAKVKLPPKKAKKGSKKKPKAKYKIYKLGSFTATGQPGTSTALTLKLGSTATGLFKKYGKLNTTLVVNVSAGPFASASKTFTKKLKSPKFPKPKKKK